MSKKSVVAREKKREVLVQKNWQKRQDIKKRAMDMTLSEEERQEARLKLNKLPRNTCAVRLRNRCQLTGRPRGFLRKFQVSRLCFREMAHLGVIPGVTKASW